MKERMMFAASVAVSLVFSLCMAAEPFNVLVPVDWVSEPYETQIKELRMMHERYGLRKFVLIGP